MLHALPGAVKLPVNGYLLSKGADPDIQSDTGRFTLEIAKAMVYADIEALLRKHGAKQ